MFYEVWRWQDLRGWDLSWWWNLWGKLLQNLQIISVSLVKLEPHFSVIWLFTNVSCLFTITDVTKSFLKVQQIMAWLFYGFSLLLCVSLSVVLEFGPSKNASVLCKSYLPFYIPWNFYRDLWVQNLDPWIMAGKKTWHALFMLFLGLENVFVFAGKK